MDLPAEMKMAAEREITTMTGSDRLFPFDSSAVVGTTILGGGGGELAVPEPGGGSWRKSPTELSAVKARSFSLAWLL